MKLLYCPDCNDVFRLTLKSRSCECGSTSGKYTDDVKAIYTGSGIPLGFSNRSFITTVQDQPEEGWGERFEAFVIPKVCSTFTKIEENS